MTLDYRGLSFWHESLTEPLTARPAFRGNQQPVDVTIIGAGYTGLWTALYLLRANPKLSVAVFEKEIAGFGASGRNGGWCSALFPWAADQLAERYGFDAAVAIREAMVDTVSEVGRITAELGIDCDYAMGGTLTVARTQAQLDRAREELVSAERFGVDKLRWLEPEAGPAFSKSLGVVLDPGCARVHPAKLVRGLARAVEELGGVIYEQSEVTRFGAGWVDTAAGRLDAKFVVEALEGYRSNLRQLKRRSIPIYSLMIATEPLPEALFDEIGLGHGSTFADFRHLLIYGQRTADNRIAFGGRGAPYHFGSRVRARYDRVPKIHGFLEASLRELLPQIGDAKITHRWGGALGVPRDWQASVGLDSATGLAWAGGYVGDGVGTSNLAGRTLADLILGKPSKLTELAWVNHRSPNWEPEPLRWLGARGGVVAAALADEVEGLTGRRSLISRLLARVTGKI
jgi:glycine/D-amino acid oxidase-like deaminating enzyme